MYPAQELLQEVGRVTIAGARLEVQMGTLWWQLDKGSVDEITARKTSISTQVDNIRRLAGVRLRGDLQARVQEAAAEAKNASDLRNNVVHQDWVLRGPDAMRPVAELAALNSQDDLDAYLEEWEREARSSPDWLRVPARSLDLVPGQTLEELKSVERRLAAAADRVAALVFAVASARETGHPTGWVASAKDPDQRRRTWQLLLRSTRGRQSGDGLSGEVLPHRRHRRAAILIDLAKMPDVRSVRTGQL